ncbi:MAG: S8/S53 family peptidase, partial [Bacteroidota bacterium]|nr:S8/S53 family peptidase [Bacteroidota bacterium]
RKIYNQTDGEKGAYIVSSNSSWGVDFGKATDAPLWCAMYDSLGKYGIVNAAATSNMNIDVDVKGDLPSTCPSKYLICVTNTNNTDMKESAGYGVTHVDLGAPGEDVYTTGSTTFNAFGYEYFGGTSASSPHVAGVVGLLYASASKEFLEGTKFRPDSIAKLMRLFIMKGTDKNNSLIAKTVSGGRLNAFGAIQSMREFCDSTISIKSANANLQAVSIFPNPAHNNLIVRILSTNKSQIEIQITDICGRLLINEKIEMPAGRFDKSINISSLSTGIYLINIIDNKSNLLLHKKIIVR